MLEAPKVLIFLCPRFVVQNFLNYVLQPMVYNYFLYDHNAMALKGGLKSMQKQKMNQKGKRKFQNERRSLESLPFCRNWIERLDFKV